MILLIQQKSWWSWLWDNWLVDIIIKGGPYIMVPLFIFSVISMGIIIERIYRYLKTPTMTPRIYSSFVPIGGGVQLGSNAPVPPLKYFEPS